MHIAAIKLEDSIAELELCVYIYIYNCAENQVLGRVGETLAPQRLTCMLSIAAPTARDGLSAAYAPLLWRTLHP